MIVLKPILMLFFLLMTGGGLMVAIEYAGCVRLNASRYVLVGLAAFVAGFVGLLCSAVLL